MTTLFACLLLVLSVGSVYATWIFAPGSLHPFSSAFGVDIGIFEYAPEEVLPGEGDNREGTAIVTPGKNYLGHTQVKRLSEMGAQPMNDQNTSKYSIDPIAWHSKNKH